MLDRGLDGDIAWYVPLVRERAPAAQVWAGEDGPTGGGDSGTCGDPAGAIRVISDCHFRKIATEYDRKPGIKWLSCTGK